MAMSATQITELVERTAYPLMRDKYDEIAPVYPEICEVLPAGMALAPEVLYGERLDSFVGVGEPDEVPYGQESPERSGASGWKVYLKVARHAQHVALPYELIAAADAIGRVTSLVTEFAAAQGHQAILKKERLVARMVQKGTLAAGDEIFDGSFAGEPDPYQKKIYDNTPFFNTAHPLKVGSGTYSNLTVSAALSQSTLQAAHTLMASTSAVDERGDPVVVMPDTLLVPDNDLRFTAQVLVESLGKTGSANNDINPLRGTYRVLPWRFLTDDSDAWWLAGTGPGNKRAIRVRDSGVPVLEVIDDPIKRVIRVEAGFYFGLAVQNWRTMSANNKATS